MTVVAFDASAAVPFVLRSHSAHLPLRRQCAGREVALTTHSLAEAYSVLTRLPGDARVTPTDAARLLAANFPQTVAPAPSVALKLPEVLAPLGIAGGAVYDALVALAALAHQMVLLTRDARALSTYAAIGVRIEMAGR
jgi:hypothetical protein